MKSDLVAVVLGGTAPHAALLDALRARGYFTILVDYFENPPARQHADKHVCASTLDRDRVVDIARENGASLIIAACVDQANTVAVYASEKLGLPRPFSFETASVISDKTLMKAQMALHNLPTPRHILVRAGDTPDVSGLRYPLVVKPADTNGSAGVRKVNNEDELMRFLAIALDLSRVGRAIIEEFVSGHELSIDCFIENGRAQIVLIRCKYAVPVGAGVDQVMQSTGSIAHYGLNPLQLRDAENILSDLARVFSLDNCPMLVQGFLTDQGLSVIEFAARLSGGTGAETTRLISGFDALEATIDSFLNVPVEVRIHAPSFHSMTNTIYAYPGVFERIEGIDELVADGTIERYLPYKTTGMVIGNDMSTKSRIGAFIITGLDTTSLRNKMNKVADQIRVLDSEGKNICNTQLLLKNRDQIDVRDLRTEVEKGKLEMKTKRWTHRPEGSNWGEWGDEDQLGRINLIGPEQVRKGAAEIIDGASFCLSLPLDYPGGNVLSAVRHPPAFRPVIRNDAPYYNFSWQEFDARHPDIASDDAVLIYTQYSTQWDSLAHRGSMFDVMGDGVEIPVYYNGFRAHDDITMNEKNHATKAKKLGIENMAAHGVQGRGVLVDLQTPFGNVPRHEVTYDDLMRVFDADNIEVEQGDVLCLWTGLDQLIMQMEGNPTDELKTACAVLDGHDPKLLNWITDSGIAAIVSDNLAIEAVGKTFPPEYRGSTLPLHEHCLFKLGLPLGELWYLADLAAHLRSQNRSRFMLTAPPLRLTGAVGSPLTPIATV